MTYTSGSDASVGFGVGVGVNNELNVNTPSNPDPVIEAHNDSVVSTKNLALITPDVRVAFFGYLLQSNTACDPQTPNVDTLVQSIDVSNPVRKRYEASLSDCVSAYQRLTQSHTSLDQSKIIAQSLLAYTVRLSDFVYKFLDQPCEVIEQQKVKVVSDWVREVAQIVPKVNDVCPHLAQALNNLYSLPTSNQGVCDEASENVKQDLESALNHLTQMKDEGGGQTKSDYDALMSEYKANEKRFLSAYADVKRLVDMTTNANNNASKSSVKTNYFLDPDKGSLSPTGGFSYDDPSIPDNVPNYHLAVPNSPTICGNCRFFKTVKGNKGECELYDFVAQNNYTCDVWQARQLTDVHTVVRQSSSDKALPKSKIEYVDTNPKPKPGVVQGYVINDIPMTELEFESEQDGVLYQDETDDYSSKSIAESEAILRANEGDYSIGDKVYVRSMNTAGMVQDVHETGRGVKVYSVRLYDRNGINSGSAVTYGSDLQPRSKSAMKANQGRGMTKANFNPNVNHADKQAVNEMAEVTRQVYKRLKGIVSKHKDFVNNPIRMSEIDPFVKEIRAVLNETPFMNAKTGARRKYYRALQDAQYALGASIQKLNEGIRAIQTLKSLSQDAKMINTVYKECNQYVYRTISQATNNLQDTLVSGSATHGLPAPYTLEELDR